jgi:hypothetical protein
MNGLQETNVYAFSGLSNGEYDNLNADTINTQELYIDGVLFDVSGVDLTNYVTSSQLSTELTPINNNIATNTTDISGLKYKTTGMTYNLATTTTTFSGRVIFNSTPTCAQSLRIDASLLVGTGGNITILNSTLQKINFLSNVTSDINSKFNDYVLTTTLSGYVTSANLSSQLANYITSSYLTSQLSNYVTSSSLSLTLSSYVTSSYFNSQLSNYVLASSLTSQLSNYVTSSGLILTLSSYVTSLYFNSQLSNYVLSSYLSSELLNYIKSSDLILTLSNYVTSSYLSSQLNNYALNSALITTNNNVTALQNKLVDIYYDVPTQYFDINHNAHIYGVLKLGLLLNVEATIDTMGTLLGVTSIAAGKATSDILTINNITLPAMNLVSANLGLRIDALETKTTNQSYNLALNTTYITGTLILTTVRLNSLDSGLLQTENQSVVFIGETEIRNDFSVTNGFGMSCDGGIIQNNNSQNTFRGGLQINNTLQCDDFTSGGTNANINSTNCNINSTTCNISGNTIIKNMSEITSGTIAPYLSILSTKLNTNNRKLQGLVIGKEQLLANEECNCNIGFNYAFGGFENYGYLGLNVNSTDTRESFRWFETGCSLPTGDLTVSEGGIIISSGDIKTNTINNRSQNLNINSSYTLNMNSDTINIGTSQSVVPPAFNSINIGNVASLSIINLNGLVYSPYQMNITGAISQW